jgi:hypothetical protein
MNEAGQFKPGFSFLSEQGSNRFTAAMAYEPRLPSLNASSSELVLQLKMK